MIAARWFRCFTLLAINLPAAALAQQATRPATTQDRQTDVLIDLTRPDHATATVRGLNPESRLTPAGLELNVPAGQWGGVEVIPTGGRFDVSGFTRVEIEVTNPGGKPVHLRAGLYNPDGTDWGGSALNEGFVRPGESKVFNVFLYRPAEDKANFPALAPFAGMSGLPGGFLTHWHNVDPANVERLTLGLFPDGFDRSLIVRRIVAAHPVVPAKLAADPAGFFPFVDKYGQYRWADWPGKIASDAQLKAAAKEEAADLAAHPGPANWDEYGGWADGPLRAATGFFRTEKVDGKWWLVDPAGRLFWSHGPDSVGYDSGATVVAGRERFFQELPPKTGPFAGVWSTAPDGAERVNLVEANLARQFGADWQAHGRDLAHQRLKSWGMNTIGNWSDPAIYNMRRTPYTVAIHLSSAKVFDGAFDVYRPDFAAKTDADVRDAAKAVGADPWCIGFFIDNELVWGNNPLETITYLTAAEGWTATKQAFVAFLQKRYPTIAAFNAKAGTGFTSWDGLLKNKSKFKPDGIEADAVAFYTEYADRYFAACGAAMKKHAPHHLYLGCRMNNFNAVVVRAAAKQCDVLSFNLYRGDVSTFRPPGGVDRPALVSEFHFGALDRGSLGTGLQPASDQADRADKYAFYVEGAARNPALVGAHWFAYCPQPITGRFDGENYETGLFTVCDTPYPELRGAVRGVGYRLYDLRFGK